MPQTTLTQLLRRLWSHVIPIRRIQLGLLFLLTIFASLAEVVSISAVVPFLGIMTAPEKIFASPFVQPLIQLLGITEPKQLILPLTIVFSLSAILSGALRLVLLWVQTRVSQGIGADFSSSVYRKTLYQPYAVHVSRNTSEVIATVRGKANSLVSHTMFPLMVIVNSIMMTLSIIIALLAIEPIIASIAFCGFSILYLLFIKLTKKALLQNGQSVAKESIQVIKSLQEGLGGIRDVLIDGTQEIYCNIYRKADLPHRRAEANIQIISNFPRYGIEALGMVLIAFLAYIMVLRSGSILDSIPVLGALAIGAQRLLPVLQLAYANWSFIRGNQPTMKDALDMLDQPLPAHADAALPSPIPFNNSITLNNLSFKYIKNSDYVLQPGFNLSIKKGDQIGLIGITGSGKSTALDIIMGLLKPTAGNLLIDGVNITEDNHRSWQAHIAHVPQHIFLSDTSITENIAFGVPIDKINHIRIREAAQKAQIAQTIESWDKQYDTIVGEDGVRLSGGQRQRIGIARALYKQADVIVFDEATSALDNNTEREVMDAIEGLGDNLTLIIVAHRLSTLRKCAKIVELDNGKISRVGSYHEIVEFLD